MQRSFVENCTKRALNEVMSQLLLIGTLALVVLIMVVSFIATALLAQLIQFEIAFLPLVVFYVWLAVSEKAGNAIERLCAVILSTRIYSKVFVQTIPPVIQQSLIITFKSIYPRRPAKPPRL